MMVVVLLVCTCDLAFAFVLIPKGEMINAQICLLILAVFGVTRPAKIRYGEWTPANSLLKTLSKTSIIRLRQYLSEIELDW